MLAAVLPPKALEIVRSYRTCELTTFSKAGRPETFPVCGRLETDGRILLTTSIVNAGKSYNIRRNPMTSAYYSEPVGSGVANPGSVLIQGRATTTELPVSDFSQDPEIREYLIEQVFMRQPSGTLMSSWLGRMMMEWYYMRLKIHVTPVRAFYWAGRDCTVAPERFEVPHVA